MPPSGDDWTIAVAADWLAHGPRAFCPELPHRASQPELDAWLAAAVDDWASAPAAEREAMTRVERRGPEVVWLEIGPHVRPCDSLVERSRGQTWVGARITLDLDLTNYRVRCVVPLSVYPGVC